jgi:hypothetical protein
LCTENELLGANIEDVKGQCDDRGLLVPLEGMKLFQVKLFCFSRYQTTVITAMLTNFNVIQLLECLQTALVCNYEALTYSIALQP